MYRSSQGILQKPGHCVLISVSCNDGLVHDPGAGLVDLPLGRTPRCCDSASSSNTSRHNHREPVCGHRHMPCPGSRGQIRSRPSSQLQAPGPECIYAVRRGVVQHEAHTIYHGSAPSSYGCQLRSCLRIWGSLPVGDSHDSKAFGLRVRGFLMGWFLGQTSTCYRPGSHGSAWGCYDEQSNKLDPCKCCANLGRGRCRPGVT